MSENNNNKNDEIKPPDEINPYIPLFIVKKPWYSQVENGSSQGVSSQGGTTHNTITHNTIPHNTLPRGTKLLSSTKFRKGACENCGAISHSRKDCVERPRKVGAKYSGEIMPDEVVVDSGGREVGYDAKRDRWEGYDASEFETKLESEENDEERSVKVARTNDTTNDTSSISLASNSIVDLRTRSTIRNLRIREDTAKYLLDLNNMDDYNPATRSMKIRDGFTGEARSLQDAQIFAWDLNKKGVGLSLQADPTMAERVIRQSGVLSKDSGGGGGRGVDDKILERYGVKKESNHSCVWGSWYDRSKMRWGYKCCKSTEKDSVCK